MRPALLAGLILALVPATGLTQTGPYLATLTDPETKLRAGPSDQFPETATLPRGATLLVDHEEANGWLAVQDPPGKLYSMSWVQAQFVNFEPSRPIPQNVVVEDDVILAAGEIGLAQPLTNVRRVRVPSGSILTVIGTKVVFDGKSWYPVAAPAGDFRYLPKQLVRFEKSINTTTVVRETSSSTAAIIPAGSGLPPGVSPSSTGSGTLPPAVPTSPPGPGGGLATPVIQHPLWVQADAAEKDGRADDAEKLYFQLARLMNEPGGDHDVANSCYTRIHSLREKKRGGTTAGNVATSAPRPPVADVTKPVSGTSQPGSGSSSAANGSDDRPKWSGPGKLVRSALDLDGRKTYALESNPGVTFTYVVAAPGVDLDRYLNRRVDVYGVSSTRRDLKKPYVVATTIETAQ